MNLFVLDRSPKLAAQYHCDSHVRKMVVETAQILQTTMWMKGEKQLFYRPTHKFHPCVKWCAESPENYYWTLRLGLALTNEFYFRWEKPHKSLMAINQATKLINWYTVQHLNEPSSFVLAMPEWYKEEDPVESYRRYYLSEKKHLFTWTKRPIPEWVEEVMRVEDETD